MVPIATIIIIALNIILGLAVPIGVLIYCRKTSISIKPFLVGCMVMLLFALVLETFAHSLILNSPVGKMIQDNVILFSLYGGLMAGLFEECGRYLAMKTVLQNEHDDPDAAIVYGLGHGGIEVMMILTLGMINYLVYAISINSGQTAALMEPLDDASKTILQGAFDMLITTPSWQFLLSTVERAAALTAQIALSVIVWEAVTQYNKLFFLLAIVLHFLLDCISGLMAKSGMPSLIIEVIVCVIAVLYVMIAKRIRKRSRFV